MSTSKWEYWSYVISFCWFNVNLYSERKIWDPCGLRPHNTSKLQSFGLSTWTTEPLVRVTERFISSPTLELLVQGLFVMTTYFVSECSNREKTFIPMWVATPQSTFYCNRYSDWAWYLSPPSCSVHAKEKFLSSPMLELVIQGFFVMITYLASERSNKWHLFGSLVKSVQELLNFTLLCNNFQKKLKSHFCSLECVIIISQKWCMFFHPIAIMNQAMRPQDYNQAKKEHKRRDETFAEYTEMAVNLIIVNVH